MTETSITQGADEFLPYQAVNRGGQSYPAYAAGDALTSFVYQGQNLVPLFSPTAGWFTGVVSGSQTGYDQGQVLVSLANADTATLEADGEYTVEVWWTPAVNPSIKARIVRALLRVKAAPGTDTQAIVPYCQLSDLNEYADWITIVQNADTDGEGFYTQRLRAREWMDWCILNQYRGSFVGQFEELSVAAFAFGNVGWRRSTGPSQALLEYLAADLLIVRPDIIRATAYKAISFIGLKQIGVNNQFASMGAYWGDMATRELSAITAEINLSGSLTATTIGNIYVNLGGTNTLRT